MKSEFAMEKDILEIIKSLIGRRCLGIEVRGDKMHLRTPEVKTIVFSEHEVAQMQDNAEYPSDYGIEIEVEEVENQIVVSMTNGMSEPYNYIYIFSK